MFFSAGGYHHHIGANTWYSKKNVLRNDNSLGLTGFTIYLPDKEFIESVKNNADQAGIQVDNGKSDIAIKDQDGNEIRLVS